MSISRRSLLHTLGALPIAYSFPALGRGFQCSPPAPGSILIEFEGPWLIYPSNGAVSAVSIGSDGGNMHECPVGHWSGGAFIVDAKLLPGAPLNLSATGYVPGDFKKLFLNAFNTRPFPWVANNKPSVTLKGTERLVTLPVPSSVHLDAFLHGAVTDGGSGILNPAQGASPINPHVASIFEYDSASGTTASVTLTLPGARTPTTLSPGDHLILRMRHQAGVCETAAQEIQHVHDAFTYLATRINGGTSLQCTITDLDYYPVTSGLCEPELGVHHPVPGCTPRSIKKKKKSLQKTQQPPAGKALQPVQQGSSSDNKVDELKFNTTYANCEGTGIILGP